MLEKWQYYLIAAVIKDFKGFYSSLPEKQQEKFTSSASVSQLNQYKKHCWTNIQNALFKNLNFNIYKMNKLWKNKEKQMHNYFFEPWIDKGDRCSSESWTILFYVVSIFSIYPKHGR